MLGELMHLTVYHSLSAFEPKLNSLLMLPRNALTNCSPSALKTARKLIRRTDTYFLLNFSKLLLRVGEHDYRGEMITDCCHFLMFKTTDEAEVG